MSLPSVFGEEMRALLADRPELVVVAPAGSAAAVALADAAAARLCAAGGLAAAAVGAGIALGGRPVVTFADTGLAPPCDAPQVILVPDGTSATALWAAGLPVVQPAWAADVPALLRAALDHAGPVVLRTDTGVPQPGVPPAGVPAASLDGARRLRRGTTAALVASGSAVAPTMTVARLAADMGVDLAVFDVTLLPGPGCLAPARTDEAILIGPVAAAEVAVDGLRSLAGLQAVDVAAERTMLDAVLDRVQVQALRR